MWLLNKRVDSDAQIVLIIKFRRHEQVLAGIWLFNH